MMDERPYYIDFRYAWELFYADHTYCPPNECIIIKCGDQIFIEEDCLTDNYKSTWLCRYEAKATEDVQELLAEWHKYRKAYQKEWNENPSMREALTADPRRSVRKLKECVKKARVYFDDIFTW